ncbi:hypothetical protein [Pseudomonas oryzihabitans]|uniref:hypothetical protein n=1 Tax=Pseudomonas oryzihabitans TaxID=47885 RepID=UPI00289624CC|nr:hypothetical protein [Pseudomonas oryzihabitans]MDT3718462.1 hypothetical protein [Pseudomonas oryzihabitans]
MTSCDRMSPEHVAQLALAIVATAEVLGQTITPDAAEMMAEDLAEYPVPVVSAALKACRRELTGRLTLAAVLQRIDAADGRPGKDEAWSIALASTDEFDTVVLTQEIQQALSAALPILRVGDKVGARMAFLSAYERLVQQARSEAMPVAWSVSLGYDAQRRIEAVEQAERMGRITPAIAQEHRQRLAYDAPTGNGIAIAGLITGNAGTPTVDVKAKLNEIRDDLRKGRQAKELQRRQEVMRVTDDLKARVDHQMEAVRRHQEAKP